MFSKFEQFTSKGARWALRDVSHGKTYFFKDWSNLKAFITSSDGIVSEAVQGESRIAPCQTCGSTHCDC